MQSGVKAKNVELVLAFLDSGYTVFGPFENKEKGEWYYRIYHRQKEIGHIVGGYYYEEKYFDREGDSDASEKESW